MSGSFFRVSGIDPNDGAKMAFVWCRVENQDGLVLIASAHIVGVDTVRPPGIHPGQFSVAFLLPHNCQADTIIATDDTDEQRALANVVIEKCTTPQGFHSDGMAALRAVRPPYPEIGQVMSGAMLARNDAATDIRS